MFADDNRLKLVICGLALNLSFPLAIFAYEPTDATVANAASIAAAVPLTAAAGGAAADKRSDIIIRATQEPTPVSTPPASVLSGSVSNEIEDVTKQILLNVIALQKFNLGFRKSAAKQGRWKGWRYFVSQEGNLALTEAGLIVSVTERGKHLTGTNSKKNSANTLANGGALPGAIGQSIAAAGSALELTINKYHSYKAKKKGFGFKQARDTAVKLVSEIDAGMAKREQLIKQEPASDREIAQMQELEGLLLADFRDLAVAEFERYHAGAKKTLAQQNSFYCLDIGKNATGVVGTFLIMHSILYGARAWNLSGGIMNTISGAMIMADPVLSRLIGDAAAKHDKKDMERHGLPMIYEKADKLEADYARMCQFCKNHQLADRPEMSTMMARVAAYDANYDYCVNEIQRVDKELTAGSRTAIQNLATSSFVGATKVTNGIMTANCGAHYVHDGIRTNTNLFAASTVYLTGVSWGLLDNVRIQTQREIKQRKLAKEHRLPGQLIQARLDELNQLESKVR